MRPMIVAPFVLVACASSAPAAPAALPAPSSSPTPAASDLFTAITQENPARIDEVLRAYPALVDANDPRGRSPVLAAMFLLRGGEGFHAPRDNRTLQALLAHHPTLDRFVAAALADVGRVRSEVARDPGYVRAHHTLGWTPLHFAAFADNAPVAGVLLDGGADLDAVADNSFRNTPLQVATLTGAIGAARVLLSRGADVKHRQEGGFTALHEAVQGGNHDMVVALLQAGADPGARNDEGKTPLDLAQGRGDEALHALLSTRKATE